MRAFITTDITDSMLIASNVPERGVGEDLWLIGNAPYASGFTVSDINHRTYESLQDNNNETPNPNADTAWWLRTGFTKRWEPFNYLTEYQCIKESPITYTIAPGRRIDSLFLGKMEGVQEVTVNVRDGGPSNPILYPKTADLESRSALTPFEFTFSPFVFDPSWVTFDIPPTGDPYIDITLTGAGTIKLGFFAVGLSVYQGKTEYGAVIGQNNFSEIGRDPFGNLFLTPIRTAPVIDQQVIIDDDRVSRSLQFGVDANAKTVVWSSLDDLDHPYARPLLLLGVYDRYDIDLAQPKHAELRLRVNGI